ncbi:MAG TPA: DUF2231 domain-containing protein [Kofleriaceae bacterium]|jgi:uncharacterized membrane protein
MYTKARIAGHPIHPMVVAFPVAFYVATAVALIVFGGAHDLFWYRAAFWTNLAGIVMAALAAVPGAIDLFTLPARSRARYTGLRHAGFNVAALILFIISDVVIALGMRHHTYALAAPLVLSLIGVGATVCAGWLGWSLVQTHHVGVKPTTHAIPSEPYNEVDDLDALVIPDRRRAHEVTLRH